MASSSSGGRPKSSRRRLAAAITSRTWSALSSAVQVSFIRPAHGVSFP
ncbi:MAG: hypothetical protein V9H26_14240 [Verrucomicrobiota bacterium]